MDGISSFINLLNPAVAAKSTSKSNIQISNHTHDYSRI